MGTVELFMHWFKVEDAMINELWLLGMRQLLFKPLYQHLRMAVANVNRFRQNYLAKRPQPRLFFNQAVLLK